MARYFFTKTINVNIHVTKITPKDRQAIKFCELTEYHGHKIIKKQYTLPESTHVIAQPRLFKK